VVFRGPNGAAAQVSCQHSHCVESIYGVFPGLKIVCPSNAYDAKGFLKTAIRDNNPVLFLENELAYGLKMEIPTEEYLIPFGKARLVTRGTDLTLVTHGQMVNVCLEVVRYFAKKRHRYRTHRSAHNQTPRHRTVADRCARRIAASLSRRGTTLPEFVPKSVLKSSSTVSMT